MNASPRSIEEYVAQEEAQADAEESALRESTVSISIRVPGDMKEQLEIAARSHGVSVSDLLRGYARAGLQGESGKSPEQVIREEFDQFRVFFEDRLRDFSKR